MMAFMKPAVLEFYKCAVLTAIAVLLAFILWRMAERPLAVTGSIDADLGTKTVYVHVENEPLNVEVQNTR
jgi:hypothetical protein